jgi:hypothetical protein
MRGLLKRPEFRDRIASVVSKKLAIGSVEEAIQLLEQKKAAKVVLEPKWT